MFYSSSFTCIIFEITVYITCVGESHVSMNRNKISNCQGVTKLKSLTLAYALYYKLIRVKSLDVPHLGQSYIRYALIKFIKCIHNKLTLMSASVYYFTNVLVGLMP